jgi:pyruvate dehydrogenase (quinone)
VSAEPARIVADLLVERLRAWHVPRVFGHPGDGVEAIVEALHRAGGEPGFVAARHEAAAAFMAAGHAGFTGGVGVCLAGPGPGAVHLLNGLYDAKLDGRAVLAVIGLPSGGPLTGTWRDIDLTRLFSDVCAQFVRIAGHAEEVPLLVDAALRSAVATRAPTCLIVPGHLQRAAVTTTPSRLENTGVITTPTGLPPARVVPHEADLNAAAQLLGSGQRVAILVGQGAAGAADEIVALADRLSAGVATSLLGKPVLDERLPFHTGVLGHLGTPAAAQLMAGCDTLLMVGTSNPWTDYYPAPGQATTVQIDVDGQRVAARYPVDVPLVGDAAETLRALLPRVPYRPNRAWRDLIEQSVDRWRAEATERTEATAHPVNPLRVFRELASRLPNRCALAVDVGSVTYWYARHLHLPPGVPVQVPGGFAARGAALPYAVAAKLATPGRPVFALLGDGAMQMTGLAELITIARHWPDWSDPRLVVLVLNNRDRGGRGWPAAAGPDEERTPEIPYAGWARMLGLHGIRVDRPELVGPAWDEALAAGRPTVLEVMVDADIALAPPERPFADLRGLPAVAPTEDPDAALNAWLAAPVGRHRR